jgi:hypothetical protein
MQQNSQEYKENTSVPRLILCFFFFFALYCHYLLDGTEAEE